MCPALFLMMRAACFLRAYAGAPVTRTLHTSLLRCGERPCDTLRAHPENAARYRCAAPLLFTSCGSVVREISPVRWVRRWFSMCAPCLANWSGGGCRGLVCYVMAGVLRVGRGGLSRFSVLPGGWVFCVWGGEGCRVLVCCVVVSLVRAEAPVPSVATSGCPKRSEGGCPCRSEDVHRPSSGQHSWVRYAKARHRHTTAAGNHFKKSQGYRTGQIRVTNSRKSSTSLPCSNRPTPKRVATSALSSNDK